MKNSIKQMQQDTTAHYRKVSEMQTNMNQLDQIKLNLDACVGKRSN